nr:immunoglobulin heavy chain junction region [Mus musculus]
CAKGWDSFDYW